MAARTAQKERTRQAIVDACAELIAEGQNPSIDDVAERSGISRATIYRYFNRPIDIVWHVMADRAMPDFQAQFDAADDGLVDRVVAGERGVGDFLFENVARVRAFEVTVLGRVIDGTATDEDRPARRLTYIDQAIEPSRDALGDRTADLLRHSLAMVIGSEAVIALTDACKLDEDDAREVTRWACEALVAHAMRGRESGER